MSWDMQINPKTWDMTGNIVSGQEEILQRIKTRLQRYHEEWFLNTDCGLPWYSNYSEILPGRKTDRTAILGSKDYKQAEAWIRNEISSTEGVLEVRDFNTYFDTNTRVFSIRASIITKYGIPYLVSIDQNVDSLFGASA